MVKKGGSRAAQDVMSSVSNCCNASNNGPVTSEINGTFHNFHLTTGGGKRKRRVKKGGSTVSRMVVQNALKRCHSLTTLNGFPGGGRKRLNKRSSKNLSRRKNKKHHKSLKNKKHHHSLKNKMLIYNSAMF